jgi:hypothetical protein
LKTVAPGSLQGFLRQHYTTSPQMAGVLASYLMSNGATDSRYGEKQRGGKDGNKPAAKPDAGAAQGDSPRAGRRTKRLAHPAEAPEAAGPAAEGQVPQAESEHGPDAGRKAKRLSKRGKRWPEQEAPKADDKDAGSAKAERTNAEPATSDNTATVEPAKPEPAKSESTKPEPAKSEATKSEPTNFEQTAKTPETAKPVESTRPTASPAQSADGDSAKGVNEALPPSLRPDPVPSVTPAPVAAPNAAGGESSSPQQGPSRP